MVHGGGLRGIEYIELADELFALLSRFSRVPFLPKMVFPNSWTLSGLSRDGMLLEVDRPEERRDRAMLSRTWSQGRSEEELWVEEMEAEGWWLRCFSKRAACFICLFRARSRSGEGGPSMAGSRSPAAMSAFRPGGDAGAAAAAATAAEPLVGGREVAWDDPSFFLPVVPFPFEVWYSE